jgi:hypothetical protein
MIMLGLNAGLQLPSKHESLLAEMLFSQMLRVPQPQLKPLAYSTLMVCHSLLPISISFSSCPTLVPHCSSITVYLWPWLAWDALTTEHYAHS